MDSNVIEVLFKAFDRDKNGTVDLKELISGT
jgi:Ca2+-binding EF-hand superfamily protein